MTTLCIDCGNTRLKWGLCEIGGLRAGAAWLAQGVLPLTEVAAMAALLPRPPARIVACNVAGPGVAQALADFAQRLGVGLAWVRSQAAQCGVANRYEQPAQLGADRWAALIGARRLHGGACLVVVAGTATTIDVLDAAGVFQGGLILPGLQLMRAALAGNTAGLPLAAGVWRQLPRNTDDAIVSGSLAATLGAVERMFGQVAVQPGALCLLSGGAAAEIEALLTVPLRRIDNLVLEGVAQIAAAEETWPPAGLNVKQ